MKLFNNQIITAVIIHALMTLWISVDPEYYIIAFFPGIVVFANLLGLFIIASGQKKIGAKIFLISSMLLIPIGLIGVFGARKILDQEERKKFFTKPMNNERNESN